MNCEFVQKGQSYEREASPLSVSTVIKTSPAENASPSLTLYSPTLPSVIVGDIAGSLSSVMAALIRD